MSPSTFPLSATTSRLILREFNNSEDDYNHLYQLESIPEVVRYQTWEPRTREKAAEVVRGTVESQTANPRSIVELAVFTRQGVDSSQTTIGNEFIGRVGCKILYQSSGPSNDEPVKAELWASFFPFAQGKGYATEALGALIDVLRGIGVKRLETECDPRNWGSRKLAGKLGLKQIKEVERWGEIKGEWVGSVEFAKDLG